MSQIFESTTALPTETAPVVPVAASNRMVGMSAAVRALTADLLGATDTRIVKIAADDTGWNVEVEVFSPNPELTISLRGGSKSILERARYHLQLDRALQLVSLDIIEG